MTDLTTLRIFKKMIKTWEINKTHLITLQYTYKILDDKCIKIINTYTQLSTVHE